MAAVVPPTTRSRQVAALLTAHLVVALVALVVIGGATRVMEAGLACPDWPLCYGSLLPGRQMNLQVFLEWFHRLDAFLVGLALLTLTALSIRAHRSLPPWLPWGSALALVLVALQGALGALTVTRLLAAPTVTAHLITALVLVLLLSALHQGLEPSPAPDRDAPRWWLALLVASTAGLLGQCLLGGSMASRWAADLCLSSGSGCPWLLAHRLGAWPVVLGVPLLTVVAMGRPGHDRPTTGLLLGASGLVILQAALGVATLRLQLQVPGVTVAHQLLAALLVALLGAVLGRSLLPSSPPPTPAFP